MRTAYSVDEPAWLKVSHAVLTCALPLALLLLYWASAVKCEKVVSLTVWGYVASVAMAVGWLAGSGSYKNA